MAQTDTSPTAKAPGNSAGVAELIALGKALGQPIQSALGFQQNVILPDGFHLVPVPRFEHEPLPDHIRQTTTLVDAESFAAYVKRYQTADTLIFASQPDAQGKNAGFLALFDFHHAANGGKTTEGTESAEVGKGSMNAEESALAAVGGSPSERPAVVPYQSRANRCAHRAVYPCPFSKPWLTWLEISGKAKSQADFIEFIDQNARDIASPPAADVLTFLENFESKTNVEFTSKIDRTRGHMALTYKASPEEGGATGAIPVPEVIVLNLPVFEGGRLWQVEGKFRWKPANGKLTVSVQLYRTDDVLRAALEAIRDEIAEKTGIVPLSGAPEKTNG